MNLVPKQDAEMRRGMPYEEWALMGRALAQSQNAMNWKLGAWLAFGEAEYGEMYADAASKTGISPDRLSILKHVYSRFPETRQRAELTWSHHLVVASLEPKAADSWLAKAIKSDWSVSELRHKVKPPKARMIAPLNSLTEIVRLTRDMFGLAEMLVKKNTSPGEDQNFVTLRKAIKKLLSKKEIRDWLVRSERSAA